MCLIIQSLVHLNNRCLPDILDDIVNHGSHDPEEFPFVEEQQILRRIMVSIAFVYCIVVVFVVTSFFFYDWTSLF